MGHRVCEGEDRGENVSKSPSWLLVRSQGELSGFAPSFLGVGSVHCTHQLWGGSVQTNYGEVTWRAGELCSVMATNNH